MSANELSALPNSEKILAVRLREAGIEIIEELKAIGSENAFIRLQAVDSSAKHTQQKKLCKL